MYFSPECHAAYAELGFSAQPGLHLRGGVQLPDGPAYFTSRGSVMGQVPGEVVAAAFAVFNPEAVVPRSSSVGPRWMRPTICAARTRGAVAQLVRVLGAGAARDCAAPPTCWPQAVAPLRPEGKPLFAGLQSLGLPGDPMGDLWRLADTLREYRGDAHTAAWTSAGLDATEVGLLTELYWGLPMRTYVRTRAWSDGAARRGRGPSRRERGLVADGSADRAPGACCASRSRWPPTPSASVMVDALGQSFDELIGDARPRGARPSASAGGYPPQGPHDLRPPLRWAGRCGAA